MGWAAAVGKGSWRRPEALGLLVALLVISGEGARAWQGEVRSSGWWLLAQAGKPAPPAPKPAPTASPSRSPAARAPREFPLGVLLKNQPLAAAAGGLLVALLIADRLARSSRAAAPTAAPRTTRP